jgi:hypothetical protein
MHFCRQNLIIFAIKFKLFFSGNRIKNVRCFENNCVKFIQFWGLIIKGGQDRLLVSVIAQLRRVSFWKNFLGPTNQLEFKQDFCRMTRKFLREALPVSHAITVPSNCRQAFAKCK